MQAALRIANSATEEIVTVQLYCDALDQYLYYLDRKADAVSVLKSTSRRDRCQDEHERVDDEYGVACVVTVV